MKSLFRHRSYLRRLTPEQRGKWFEQRRRLHPRVPISTMPATVARSFSYIKLA